MNEQDLDDSTPPFAGSTGPALPSTRQYSPTALLSSSQHWAQNLTIFALTRAPARRPRAPPRLSEHACYIVIPGEEVKNGKTLHYKLSEPTISILDTYLGRYWPLLLKGTAYTALFVSRHGGQKRPCRRRAGHRHGSGVAPRSGTVLAAATLSFALAARRLHSIDIPRGAQDRRHLAQKRFAETGGSQNVKGRQDKKPSPSGNGFFDWLLGPQPPTPIVPPRITAWCGPPVR